ncbi:MAG: hypothetical protein U1E87_05650 [Alphaproteobacteria bacterium]
MALPDLRAQARAAVPGVGLSAGRTPQAPAAAGLALPAMLKRVGAFPPSSRGGARLGLLALAGAGLLVGAVGGLGARRTLSVFAA